MEPKRRFLLIYVAIAALGALFVAKAWTEYQAVAPIPYSEFLHLLKDGKVEDLVISQDEISGSLTEAVEGRTRFTTTRVDPDLAKVLDQHGVTYSEMKENSLMTSLMSWVLPLVLLVGFWLFIMRRAASQGDVGGLMAIGQSKAKVYVETDTKVTFEDVAGVEEAKEELQEVVSFLRDPGAYGRLGARMPKGMLLVGPPGTGKTLLARAVAGEAAVPFFSISGSEFVEMFVGVGAARVRDLFEQARQKAPCIIFIDELDALGRARQATPFAGGQDEKEQTLNQLLVELDGFDPQSGIVLLAATNRPEILDPALLRAGRFDRHVVVDRPDRRGRAAILKVHMKEVLIADDTDTDAVAALTPGFTGADLANLVNEAALVATRRDAEAVSLSDFTEAIERIVAGLEKKNRLLNPKEREIVAFHEMGHALVAVACPLCDPVQKVSIIPRGISALGYTLQRPTEERYLMTREELEQRMAVMLGGRAAERLVFHHLSTGAADDLSKATETARSMVTQYGMAEDLGYVTYDSEPASVLGVAAPGLKTRTYSEATAREIDTAMRDFIQRAFDRAFEILKKNQDPLNDAAKLLLAEETLSEEQLKAIFARVEW